MHASIRRFHAGQELDGDPAWHGRRLATTMSELPGFVSFAMVEVDGGLLASIAIFEDRGGLAAGDTLLSRWLEDHYLELDAGSAVVPVITGEIIVQRGM